MDGIFDKIFITFNGPYEHVSAILIICLHLNKLTFFRSGLDHVGASVPLDIVCNCFPSYFSHVLHCDQSTELWVN